MASRVVSHLDLIGVTTLPGPIAVCEECPRIDSGHARVAPGGET